MRIILASASPRRKELLEMLGVELYRIEPAKGPEALPAETDPAEIVRYLALQKAEEIFQRYPDALVLGADTIVWLDGRILGKPKDEEEAETMLHSLSGRCHEVYTGVALLDRRGALCAAEQSRVTFRKLGDREIRNYIRSGEPMDKAGAYGAQGKAALFVERIEGDFFNVMGLPICLLGQMLAEKGVYIL